MANTTLLPILAMLIILLQTLLPHNCQMVLSMEDKLEEEEEDYFIDTPFPFSHLRTKSRFLRSTKDNNNVIKKGTRCDNSTTASNICNGIPANKGTALLFCCKKHCRNVLSDKNNCKVCGHKCKQGERCCNGVCTNVLVNGGTHCGKCNRNCSPGVHCENGFCGYA